MDARGLRKDQKLLVAFVLFLVASICILIFEVITGIYITSGYIISISIAFSGIILFVILYIYFNPASSDIFDVTTFDVKVIVGSSIILLVGLGVIGIILNTFDYSTLALILVVIIGFDAAWIIIWIDMKKKKKDKNVLR